MSQHIVMSHVKVGPYPAHKGDDNGAYNRPLSEIREEVEANNFDVFISIHSNAAGEGSPSNYPLFIFRGKDDETYSAPGSKAMAQHIWPYAFSNEHQMWSYYSKITPTCAATSTSTVQARKLQTTEQTIWVISEC